MLAISASKRRETWALLTADVQAALLKGEIQDKDRVLYCWPPKNGPALPGVQPGSLLFILKGVFRLYDENSECGSDYSHCIHQVGALSGVVCFHVDDMLGTSNELFESKLKELDKLIGFGSMKRQKFDHCGRQYEKHANVEITISMKAKIQNLRKASLTLERTKQLDHELQESESHEFRGINRCL